MLGSTSIGEDWSSSLVIAPDGTVAVENVRDEGMDVKRPDASGKKGRVFRKLRDCSDHRRENAIRKKETMCMNNWLKDWDNSSKNRRKRMLKAFIKGNGDSTPREFEQIYGKSAASLILSRFSTSLRLTYLVGFCLSLQIEAIQVLVLQVGDEVVRENFLRGGTLITIFELISMNEEHGVSPQDRAAGIRLLTETLRRNILVPEVICQYHGLDAIRECLTTCEDNRVHVQGVVFFEILGIRSSKFALQITECIRVLLNSENVATRETACLTLQKLLLNPKSCVFESSARQLLVSSVVGVAVSLLQSASVRVQAAAQQLTGLLFDKIDAFVVSKKLFYLLYTLPVEADQPRESEGAEVVPRSLCILQILEKTVISGPSYNLSSLCSIGLVNALVGSILNIHSYDVQKKAIHLSRVLATRFAAAKTELEQLLGAPMLSKIIGSDSAQDGRIIRTIVTDKSTFTNVTQKLSERGWDTSHRNSQVNIQNRDDADGSLVPEVAEFEFEPVTAADDEEEDTLDGIPEAQEEKDGTTDSEDGSSEEDEASGPVHMESSQDASTILHPSPPSGRRLSNLTDAFRTQRIQFPLESSQLNTMVKDSRRVPTKGEKSADIPQSVRDKFYIPTDLGSSGVTVYRQSFLTEMLETKTNDEDTLKYVKGLPGRGNKSSSGTSRKNAIVVARAEIVDSIPFSCLPDIHLPKKGVSLADEPSDAKLTLEQKRRDREQRLHDIQKEKQKLREVKIQQDQEKEEEEKVRQHQLEQFTLDFLIGKAIKQQKAKDKVDNADEVVVDDIIKSKKAKKSGKRKISKKRVPRRRGSVTSAKAKLNKKKK